MQKIHHSIKKLNFMSRKCRQLYNNWYITGYRMPVWFGVIGPSCALSIVKTSYFRTLCISFFQKLRFIRHSWEYQLKWFRGFSFLFSKLVSINFWDNSIYLSKVNIILAFSADLAYMFKSSQWWWFGLCPPDSGNVPSLAWVEMNFYSIYGRHEPIARGVGGGDLGWAPLAQAMIHHWCWTWLGLLFSVVWSYLWIIHVAKFIPYVILYYEIKCK